MKSFSLIMLAKDEDKEFIAIEKICYEYNINIEVACSLCDLFDMLAIKKYDFLVLDDKLFPVEADLLYIFERKNFFVPNVILLSNKKIELKDGNIVKFRRMHIDKLEEYILDVIRNYTTPVQENLTTKNRVYIELCNLGFNQKYKGFNYLLEIINKILNTEDSIKSFRKYIYPYIASLYCVTEESVERDVRNLLKIIYKKFAFRKKINFNDRQQSPTTRNIVNTLILYLKSNIEVA